MAIQGHLTTIKIPELFSFLHQLRKTGTLCLVSESEERVFIFHQGELVYASTKDTSRRLGNFLVRLGILSEAELSSTLEKAAAMEAYFGEVLIETGRISEEQLTAAVREQVMDILEDTLTWTSGAFHFDDNDIPSTLPYGSKIPTQGVLFGVTSKADERQRVKELFPDSNLILAQESGKEAVTAEEKQILELVDGKQTLEQLFFRSAKSRVVTAETLKALLMKGALRPAGVRVTCSPSMPTPELRSLPVAPEIPGRILYFFNCPSNPKSDLIEVLAQDPMLVANVLKTLIANGVELPRPSFSVEYMVELLNPFELRSILVPEAIRGLYFPGRECFWKEYWEHSLFCALLSEQVASVVDYQYTGEAYVAGLLHNLGAYILMNRDPGKYREVITEACKNRYDLEILEEERFGISHTRLGGIHSEKWNFPHSLVLCIKHHHKVDDKVSNPLLHVVSVANGIAQELNIGVEHSLSAPRQFEASLKQLNLSRSAALDLVNKIPRSTARQFRLLATDTKRVLKTDDRRLVKTGEL